MMNLDIETGLNIIQKAIEKEQEEKLWQQWLQLYPHMNKDNFITFSEFLKRNRQMTIKSNKTTEELLEFAEKVKNADQKGR